VPKNKILDFVKFYKYNFFSLSMKTLSLHCDYIKFKPVQKALKEPEKLDKESEKEKKVNECLVIFTAVEKTDKQEDSELLVEEIEDIAKQVKANRIVLYPYAHLSSNLASPDLAIQILKDAEKQLKSKFEVIRAPFGYYKEFELKCKGHPLAELSRTIEGAKTQTYNNKIKAKGKDSYVILTHEGKEHEVENYKFKKDEENFKMLVEKEAMKKGLEGGKEPKFIEYANQFQIEWEPMSDKGHMRYGPSGTLIFNLISDYSEIIANSLGIPVYSVKGTNMFNLNEPAIKEHAELFGDRLYQIEIEGRKFVMRYAACHQQFAMIKDWNISYKNLPFGALEVADSYRLEQAGELLLAFRTRRMDMPDLHVFCKDFEESKEWFKKIHERIYEEISKIGDDYEILFNFSSRKHFEENKKWVLSLLRSKKKNALLHFYPEGINYYWTFNIEYMTIDELKRPREIATVQIDIGNAKRFNIKYRDSDNTEKYPVILHTAIIGTIGRYIFANLDKLVREEIKGKKPQLPYWLSPIQARILPLSEKFTKESERIAEKMNSERIRTDVDDRDITLPKKVSDAEKEWVPYIVVIGEKEIKTKKLAVRIRQTGKIEKISEKKLVNILKKEQDNMPFKPLPLPILMSKRPVFVG